MNLVDGHTAKETRRWFGDVPPDWSVIPIKRLFVVVNGATPKSDDEASWNGGVVWITPSDLSARSSKYVCRSRKTLTAAGLASCGASLVPASSIVLSTRAPIGSLALAGDQLCTNQGCKSLIPGSRANSEFYDYVLQAAGDELQSIGKGTTFRELSTESLSSLDVPFPTAEVQAGIVRFLDFETARIDTLIDKQKKLIELLKEKRQAVISQSVTKGLDPDVPMKDSGVEWLGEVPAHWTPVRLGFLVTRIEQGWSPQCNATPPREGEYGVLKVGSVNYGVFRPMQSKSLPEEMAPLVQYSIRKNDLLISRANTKDLVGSAAVSDDDYPFLLLCDKLYRLALNRRTDVHFVSLFLGIGATREQLALGSSGASSSMQNIGQQVVTNLTIALPSLAEQRLIVKEVRLRARVISEIEERASAAIQLLEERRSALITAAVTGQIDVTNYTATSENAAA